VTLCAALLCDRLGRMLVVKIRVVVIGRREPRPFGVVALRATKWRIDLVMADQTVGHQRHVGIADTLRRIDSTMTRKALIRRLQMRTDIIRIAEVSLVIDRAGNGLRNVP